MSKNNSQSFNKLKQKLKKYLQGTGPSGNTYEMQLAKFRENPLWSEDEQKAKAKKTKEKSKKEPKKESTKDPKNEEEKAKK
mmetsp:Transcript_25520/g.19287  ORF Transcript_25520/g.19287 Transcript_25520/m.19287 type:complete len:81 (+) Transcript_25520:435-677(+)